MALAGRRHGLTLAVMSIKALLPLAGAVLAAAALAAPAAQATDGSPCVDTGKDRTYSGYKVRLYNCPLVAKRQIPVYRTDDKRSTVVGYIDGTRTNWFLYSYRNADPRSTPWVNGYHNVWWASTLADNGRWGWVNQVYFRGGGNDERDGRLLEPPNLTCSGSCGSVPTWMYPSRLRGSDGQYEPAPSGGGRRPV